MDPPQTARLRSASRPTGDRSSWGRPEGAAVAASLVKERALGSYSSFSATLKCSLRWGSVWPAQPLGSALSPPLA